MEYEPGDFFTEHDDDAVKGFAIIETDESEGYRIAEKWQHSGNWTTYWRPADQLLERVVDGNCEKTKTLSDEQFNGLLKLAGVKLTPRM